MIDAVDGGLAAGDQILARTSDTEALRSVAMTGAPVSPATPSNQCRGLVDIDIGAHPGQLRHMHEDAKNRLGDHGGAFGNRHQDHELRLQIGRAGIGLGHHVNPGQAVGRCRD